MSLTVGEADHREAAREAWHAQAPAGAVADPYEAEAAQDNGSPRNRPKKAAARAAGTPARPA
jgi:hypothetical protein